MMEKIINREKHRMSFQREIFVKTLMKFFMISLYVIVTQDRR